MGVAADNQAARLAASLGELNAVEPIFAPALDVPYGGVLCALPALISLGLLESSGAFFKLPKGYYGLDSLLLLMAFMALARVESVEGLRYQAPGEWGQLLGLDRIPEVRTLREKLRLLAAHKQSKEWNAALCRRWMEAAPNMAGTLYVDGHVRVYNGSQTTLPRHYVSRQKLCQRATTDYWVNAMDGQPFFVVNQAVDPGLIHVLEGEIMPRLDREIACQPSPEALAADPRLHRYTLVFDREGYSPDFMSRMKVKRVACLTYHKHPGAPWDDIEFFTYTVTLASGDIVSMDLAERGSALTNGLWVREVRKRSEGGHQTAMISTDYHMPATRLAATMFARWSQENFFKYAREHFGLDRLADYQTEAIPDTVKIINPEYREVESKIRRGAGKLSRQLAQFGAINLESGLEPAQIERINQKKADRLTEIEAIKEEVATLKAKRKTLERRLFIKDLPEEHRFEQLSTQSKHFVDTIKMVAYRAETAMAHALREYTTQHDEARVRLRALYTSEADLLPDLDAKTLTVRLHHTAQRHMDVAMQKLCEELTATETVFPRTDLRMIFILGSSQILRDQVV
jgi:hypothetical protein